MYFECEQCHDCVRRCEECGDPREKGMWWLVLPRRGGGNQFLVKGWVTVASRCWLQRRKHGSSLHVGKL